MPYLVLFARVEHACRFRTLSWFHSYNSEWPRLLLSSPDDSMASKESRMCTDLNPISGLRDNQSRVQVDSNLDAPTRILKEAPSSTNLFSAFQNAVAKMRVSLLQSVGKANA